jgi:hypothetical protein
MNIYLIRNPQARGYDVYDSAVVAAASAEAAAATHPAGCEWDGSPTDEWRISADKVEVRLIGRADDACPAGVVCASYNAG